MGAEAYAIHMYWADHIGTILDALDESIASTVPLTVEDMSAVLSWAEELHATNSSACTQHDMSLHDQIRQCRAIEIAAPHAAAVARLKDRADWLRQPGKAAFGGSESDGLERAIREIKAASDMP
jgi:hypothetical protein